MRPGDSLAAMLRRADALLYRAKAKGRNCVEADEISTPPAKPVLVERLAAARPQSGRMA